MQIEALAASPLPGATIRQFTAQDLVSRWGVAQVCRRATAQATRGFLGQMLQRFPSSVQAMRKAEGIQAWVVPRGWPTPIWPHIYGTSTPDLHFVPPLLQ